MALLRYVLSDFSRFVDTENKSVDTRIVILCQLKLDTLARLISNLGYQYVLQDNNCIICKIRDMKLCFITIPNLIIIYILLLYNVSKLNLVFNI